MSFERLISKVRQAEDALEARERLVVAHLQQVRTDWRAAWTPGRIVIAGLATGFLAGRAQPLKLASQGGQWMQLVSLLSGLFASANAQAAASHAENAADPASDTAQAVAPDATAAGNVRSADAAAIDTLGN